MKLDKIFYEKYRSLNQEQKLSLATFITKLAVEIYKNNFPQNVIPKAVFRHLNNPSFIYKDYSDVYDAAWDANANTSKFVWATLAMADVIYALYTIAINAEDIYDIYSPAKKLARILVFGDFRLKQKITQQLNFV
jgi:hypothetical protein